MRAYGLFLFFVKLEAQLTKSQNSQYSLSCLHIPPAPFAKISQIDHCHLPHLKLQDMTQIDGTFPSVSPACQMAGGLQSPDIHQCLAVRCSHSSCSDPGTGPADESPTLQWGGLYKGLGRMMPSKEVPLPVSFWKSGQYGTAFPIQLCDRVPLIGAVNAFQGHEKKCAALFRYDESFYPRIFPFSNYTLCSQLPPDLSCIAFQECYPGNSRCVKYNKI